jgi:uncharacterized protein (UPF0332 family)
MSTSANDLLSQAEQLLAAATTEVEFRNGIGRAYYAAYYRAKEFHESLPTRGQNPTSNVGVHAELQHRLLHPTIASADLRFRTSQNLSRHLEWLHSHRIRADYRLLQTVTREQCAEVVARAARVFELLS